MCTKVRLGCGIKEWHATPTIEIVGFMVVLGGNWFSIMY